MFDDTNIDHSLDAIAEYGTGKIQTEIGMCKCNSMVKQYFCGTPEPEQITL